ncbi:MAG: tRNA wybutosine-synthesizing 3 family protein [Candidatus Woesearchaeota archaeon]
MDRFDLEKKDVLRKLSSIDKSKKGSVDSDILDLINLINSKKDYYTTSSCSGRIMLIDKGAGRKDLSKWLLSSHFPIETKDFLEVFSDDYLSSEEFKKAEVWFMEEPAILHVCARDIDSAKVFLELVREISFKRSGIISMSRRIIIEILDTEKMETLVTKKGKLYVDPEYADILVKEANNKLKRTKDKLKRLYDKIYSK